MANSFQMPTTQSGLIQSAYPYTDFAGVTPSNAQVSGQTDASLWSNGPGFEAVCQGSSAGDSSLRHNSHLGIDIPSDRSYDTNVLDHNYLGVQSSSQPQQNTYQQHQNDSSQYYPDHTYPPPRDGDGSHNLIDTRRRWSAPDIGHRSNPHVGSSLQYPRRLPQNQQDLLPFHPHTPDSAVPNAAASGDILYAQAQATGLSAANFWDNSYHGVGLFSQPHRRSIGYSVQRNRDAQLHHPVPVEPSTLSPANANVRVTDRLYLRPASWSSTRDEWASNMASSSTGPRRSNHKEVNYSTSSLPTVEEGAVGFPTTSLSQEPSLDSPTYIPQVNRELVPLRTWIPKKRKRGTWSNIDFQTVDNATGRITPGTYLADHLDNNPDRSLIDPDKLPFPGKRQTMFDLQICVGSALLLPHVTEIMLGIG